MHIQALHVWIQNEVYSSGIIVIYIYIFQTVKSEFHLESEYVGFVYVSGSFSPV